MAFTSLAELESSEKTLADTLSQVTQRKVVCDHPVRSLEIGNKVVLLNNV